MRDILTGTIYEFSNLLLTYNVFHHMVHSKLSFYFSLALAKSEASLHVVYRGQSYNDEEYFGIIRDNNAGPNRQVTSDSLYMCIFKSILNNLKGLLMLFYIPNFEKGKFPSS